jgi:uncharacterized membrane protein YeiH
MTWVYAVDLIGTSVFAISGVLTAMQKKFDLIGTLVIGFVTAIGGGTLRDMMIGRTPVGWLTDRNYIIVIVAAYVIAYVFRERILVLRKGLFLFDTIGIGLFTVLGIQVSLSKGLLPEVCLMMGVISACFGGVIRDVLTNVVPLIFRKEIYATACILGGIVYLLGSILTPYDTISTIAAMATVMIIRLLAVKYHWTLGGE